VTNHCIAIETHLIRKLKQRQQSARYISHTVHDRKAETAEIEHIWFKSAFRAKEFDL